MKKIILITISVLVIVTLSACALTSNSSDEDYQPVIWSNDDNISNTQWRELLKDYENFVDKYIEITEKYSANPSDFSILSDYTEMTSELTEWTEKIDEVQDNLTVDEAIEFSKEIARIADKLTNLYY